MAAHDKQSEPQGGREAFRQLSPRGKLQYIWDYEKLPLLGLLVLAVIVGNVVLRQVTKKETLVSAAVVNVQIGEDTTKTLTEDFAAGFPGGTRKNQVQLNAGLLLTDSGLEDRGETASSSETVDGASYEYAYASGMKLLALMTSKSLDVVLMDPVAYDQFSRNDYLLPLGDVPELKSYRKYLTPAGDALLLRGSTLYREAGFSGDVCIAVIVNTQRKANALRYVRACLR